MASVPTPIRIVKHALFSVLPGPPGLRNRACFHHLTRRPVTEAFETALAAAPRGALCIDCGANRGDWTEKFLDRGLETHAFEPDPWSFARLSERLEGRAGLHLVNKAVGTTAGTTDFYRDAEFAEAPEWHSLASSIYPRADRPQQKVTVEVIDFLQFLRDLDRDVAVIKMDIEGAEVPILEALFASELVSRIGHLFVETHEMQFPGLLERTWALRARAETLKGCTVNLDWR